MNKILIDTNIVFSTILNINSRIGQIIINGDNYYGFYSPEYTRFEIFKHKHKIKEIGKLTENEFIETYELVLRNISILNHTVVPVEFYIKASEICTSIDINDTVFVAFKEFMKGKLWTEDKTLIQGLTEKSSNDLSRQKNYIRILLKRKDRRNNQNQSPML